ncbi:MAG TPA: hypothetical protein VH482_36420 [Thermomicrobiales bacterium]|jgi:hypothetical protein
MDVLIVFLLLIIGAMIAGAAVYVPRELRKGGSSPMALEPGGTNLDPLRVALEARYEAEVERLRAESQRVIGDVETELGRLRETLRTSAHEQESQIVRLRERYAEVDGQTTQALEQALRDLRSHHDAELGRLREAIGAAIAAIAARQRSVEDARGAARRAEAIGELYRRLTKLETTFVSVTNPVLLPGEPFVLPPELSAEALRWEPWKEVGDATFAFAETFAQHRLEFDDATCRDLTAFIREVRGLLTRSIYPNLQAAATNPETRAALRKALDQLGAEIPRAREGLERAYREQDGER